MRDWRKLEKKTIFEGNDEDGNLFLQSFLRDYKNTFHPQEINAGCERCLNDYYINLIKYLNTMGTKSKNKSAFQLKKMYEGITLKFGSGIIVRNNTITDEQGEYLLKNHPRGKDLFDKTGTPKPPTDRQLSPEDLRAKYPTIDPKLNKKDFLKAVTQLKKDAKKKAKEDAKK